MQFEDLLLRDLSYPIFMDWPNVQADKFGNILYTNSKNKRRQVLYSINEYNDYSEEIIYDTTRNEHTAYYYGSKVSRSDGPAYIERQTNLKINFKYHDRFEKDHYKVEWKIRNNYVRKNAPAYYDFTLINKRMSNLYMEWHCKPKYYFQGTLHRLNGPAIHKNFSHRPVIKYYIHGKRYNEYDYWKYMLKNYPRKLPKIILKTNKKIIFETDLKKPAPKIMYLKIKRLQYQYDCENMSSSKYWSLMDNYLSNRYKWLILK